MLAFILMLAEAEAATEKRGREGNTVRTLGPSSVK